MTTNLTPEQFEEAAATAKDILRRRIEGIERGRDEQPARLAKARAEAEEARGWSLIEEPFESQVTSIKSVDGTASLSLPNITARELWGARLCFDLLDCGDDYEQIDEVIGRLFTTVGGDTGIAMVVMSAALSTIASLVVPQLLEEIAQHASNWDERVRLCEARAKAWSGRAENLHGPQDEAAECGIKPVDSFDIAATALDDPDWEDIDG